MAKAKRRHRKIPEVELVADAWPRFERFIREVVKAGPQHRERAKPKRQKRPRPS
jgi:hypothetical protein